MTTTSVPWERYRRFDVAIDDVIVPLCRQRTTDLDIRHLHIGSLCPWMRDRHDRNRSDDERPDAHRSARCKARSTAEACPMRR